MNINKALDKAFESKTLKEILDAPVSALAGVSETDGKLLEEAFGIKTVADLGKNKYFLWAQSITNLSATEE
ncbi:MAG: hypothetical protein HY818_08040 [Acetobacterium woodii]|nr:hypothetical protein [Acetobacterium woodii]